MTTKACIQHAADSTTRDELLLESIDLTSEHFLAASWFEKGLTKPNASRHEVWPPAIGIGVIS